MPIPHPLTPLPVVLPLAGAALLAGLRSRLPRAWADSLAILVATAALLVSLHLLRDSLHAPFVYWFGYWFPRASFVPGIGFVVEPIGALVASLAAFLTLLALVFSWREVDSGGNHAQPLLLIFLAAMAGFALTADFFNMFVFFELMSTVAFALCGLKTAEPAPLQGSFNFAVTNTVAAFLVLTGIALLYAVTGALNLAAIGLALGSRHDPLVLFAFTLVTAGFLTKGAIVPFHLWLPDAHAVAPTPVCVLFSGIMVELGLFAVIRLQSVVFGQTFSTHPGALRLILGSFALATVLIGSLMCYAEHHLKRVLAFSTVAHAGLMLLGIAVGGPTAVAAMLVYLLAHAFIKSSLFFTAGILLHRLRSISERALFGAGLQLRPPSRLLVATLWFAGGAGLAAAPIFATFLGEAGISHAAEEVHLPGVSLLFLFAGVLTGAAVFRIGLRTFFKLGDTPPTDPAAEVGELPETQDQPHIEPFHVGPPALCLVLALILAFWHGWLTPLAAATQHFTSQASYAQILYTGHTAPATAHLWSEALPGAALRGLLATIVALLLALSSTLRSRLPRPLRIGAFLESGIPPLRTMQSGHPGDYVTWLTVGLTTLALATLLFLRP